MTTEPAAPTEVAEPDDAAVDDVDDATDPHGTPSAATEDPVEPAPADEEAEPADEPTPPADDDAAKVYDFDAPDLESRERYPARASSAEADRRARRKAKGGGVLVGVGVAAAVIAPIVIVRPRPTITPDTGNGSTLNLRTSAGSLLTGSLVSVAGGVAGIFGGRMLSGLGVDPSRATRRERGLAVASGVAFGASGAMLVAGVVELARGRVLWNEVLGREFGPDDVADADDAGRRMSRGLALFAAALPVAGLGLGLSLGPDAHAKVVPTRNGVAVLGRF